MSTQLTDDAIRALFLGEPYRTVADGMLVSDFTVRRLWAKHCADHGIEMRRPRGARPVPDTKRAAALSMVRAGRKHLAVAYDLGIGHRTVQKIVSAARQEMRT